MQPAPIPTDDAQRVASLQDHAILDTEAEQEYDDAVRLAALICGVPSAVISLVDKDRQWFKARVGTSMQETARDISFCGHAILERSIFEVPDATQDQRFHDNPLVLGEPHVRFYAGAQLLDEDGLALGMLCVTDTKPRELSQEQRTAMEALARQVTAHLRLRIAYRTLQDTVKSLSGGWVSNGPSQAAVNHIAHELRTPLTPMLLNVAALRHKANDPDCIRMLQSLKSNLERLNGAIAQVLVYTASSTSASVPLAAA